MKENTTDKINLSKDDCDVDCKIVSTHDIIDPITLSILDTVPKGKLFDYGCGDCFLTKKVMQLGFDVIGFDVDTKTLLSARRKDSRLDVLTQNEFYRSPFEFRGKFDVVLCSLVVCVIEENRDLLQLFSNIASLIKPDGTLVLSLCNPRYTHVKRTKLQTKLIPGDFSPSGEAPLVFKKRLRATGNVRKDVHRNLKKYLALLSEYGFEVEAEVESDTINLDNGEQASDFLWLRCKKRG